MKLFIFILLFTNIAMAKSLEMSFSTNDAKNTKSYLLKRADQIIKQAHKSGIEIYKENIQNAKCIDSGAGASGTCIIDGDAFGPNSSSRWIINVTTPLSYDCNYNDVKVTFTFMDSEC